MHQKYPNSIIQGQTFALPKENIYAQIMGDHYQNWLKSNLTNKLELKVLDNKNLAVPKQIFKKIGNFSEKQNLGSQDIEFGLRTRNNGIKIIFQPKAVAWHHERDNLKAFLKQHLRIANSESALDKDPGKVDKIGVLAGNKALMNILSGIKREWVYIKKTKIKEALLLPLLYLALIIVRLYGFISTFFKQRKGLILLASITLLYIFLDLYFLINDKTPQSWDQSLHLTHALNIQEYLKNGHFLQAFKSTLYYPPLYYLVTIPIYFFKTYPPYPLFINFLFLAILLFSVYKLACEYFDQRSGFIATLLIASYPTMILLRRNYLLDFPLAAMVALSLYSFHKTNGLLKKKETIIAGIVTALCLLTKEFGAIYLIPFYAIMSITSFFKTKDKRFQIANLAIFITIVLVVSSIWYIPSINYVSQGFGDLMMYAKLENDPIGFNLPSLTYYLKHFSWQLSPILSWLTLLSAPILLLNRTGRKFAFVAYPTILFAYLTFVLIPNKDPRYVLSLFIFFAIITAGALSSLKKRLIIFRQLGEFILVFICLSQSLSLTIGRPNINSDWYPFPTKPNPTEWNIIEVVKKVKEESMEPFPRVAIIPDHPQINRNSLDYYSMLEGIDIEYSSVPPEPIDSFYTRNMIYNSNFVIDMEPLEAATQTPLRDNVIKLHRDFSLFKRSFTKISSYDLPDSSRLILYQNNLK